MTEADVFSVQDPETGELGFVSVMGLLGEHYAISHYLGSEGLYAIWNLQDVGPSVRPSSASETLFEIPQLQASFEGSAGVPNKRVSTILLLQCLQ
jgi:hypothetical protein